MIEETDTMNKVTAEDLANLPPEELRELMNTMFSRTTYGYQNRTYSISAENIAFLEDLKKRKISGRILVNLLLDEARRMQVKLLLEES